MTAYVRRGAKAPEALRLKIRNAADSTEPLDLSSVSGQVPITATSEDGKTTKTWSAAIENQSATLLTILYTWASGGGDVPRRARYELMVAMTTPAGERRAGPMILQVT